MVFGHITCVMSYPAPLERTLNQNSRSSAGNHYSESYSPHSSRFYCGRNGKHSNCLLQDQVADGVLSTAT